ncbi:hypothetical protein EUX98_g6014 [Antrodiella citrinella]|uniref:Uncharacterized protein n=1 Tax=Antrodiella citrinella TaxID=2447956 RepID=A0A4S4MQ21_9APHY|nr:hypothetical protein EUX98_g6014 [Antrodiella citrinella]
MEYSEYLELINGDRSESPPPRYKLELAGGYILPVKAVAQYFCREYPEFDPPITDLEWRDMALDACERWGNQSGSSILAWRRRDWTTSLMVITHYEVFDPRFDPWVKGPEPLDRADWPTVFEENEFDWEVKAKIKEWLDFDATFDTCVTGLV